MSVTNSAAVHLKNARAAFDRYARSPESSRIPEMISIAARILKRSLTFWGISQLDQCQRYGHEIWQPTLHNIISVDNACPEWLVLISHTCPQVQGMNEETTLHT